MYISLAHGARLNVFPTYHLMSYKGVRMNEERIGITVGTCHQDGAVFVNVDDLLDFISLDLQTYGEAEQAGRIVQILECLSAEQSHDLQ